MISKHPSKFYMIVIMFCLSILLFGCGGPPKDCMITDSTEVIEIYEALDEVEEYLEPHTDELEGGKFNMMLNEIVLDNELKESRWKEADN